jgi:hypothetical protein
MSIVRRPIVAQSAWVVGHIVPLNNINNININNNY